MGTPSQEHRPGFLRLGAAPAGHVRTV